MTGLAPIAVAEHEAARLVAGELRADQIRLCNSPRLRLHRVALALAYKSADEARYTEALVRLERDASS